MLIWQQPLMPPTSGGFINLQPNAKYIPSGVIGTTGSGFIARDSDGMIHTWTTGTISVTSTNNKTNGGTITAPFDFSGGPILAFTGTWRWAGSSQELHINVGGNTTKLRRTSSGTLSLDGSGFTVTTDSSQQFTLKWIIDLNANTSTVFQRVNGNWTKVKTVPFSPASSALTGYVYNSGEAVASQTNNSVIYGAGIYNNADLASA